MTYYETEDHRKIGHNNETGHHYDRLAQTYERNWANRPEYVSWMADRIADWLSLEPGARIADIGSGTGLFLRRLTEIATAESPILCVDPSQLMLDLLPADPRLRAVCATAEDIASSAVPVPYDELDAVVFKESIHHVADIPETLSRLADRLAPGGSILIVTLPARLEYPLFTAALGRFALGQPDPGIIAQAMHNRGLEVKSMVEEFQVNIDREQWLGLVANRWMSVLSTFSDDELRAGLDEIRADHTEPRISYPDRFAFIRGRLA